MVAGRECSLSIIFFHIDIEENLMQLVWVIFNCGDKACNSVW